MATNCEGLTFAEWAAAARFAGAKEDPKAWRRAWAEGEDPTEAGQ